MDIFLNLDKSFDLVINMDKVLLVQRVINTTIKDFLAKFAELRKIWQEALKIARIGAKCHVC